MFVKKEVGRHWPAPVAACGLAGLFLLFAIPVKGDEAAPVPFITLPRLERPLTLEELRRGGPVPRAAVVRGFLQRRPREGEPPSQETTAYLAYDQKQLYVGFVCLDNEPHKIRANVTRRDSVSENDFVWVLIDTYRDHRRGYLFVVNPLGIQEDSLWTEPHYEDPSFDTLWYAQAQITKFGYVALLRIPFKSLRFSPEREQTWGMLLGRYHPRFSEESTWPKISQAVDGWLIQGAEIRGLADIAPGKNVQLTPYGAFTSSRFLDKETNQFRRRQLEERLGLDAKWVVASNLTLDATVNPDFSQVESDQPQITVNRRFEVFFPEKRPFFLENRNYFRTPTTVLFTRRIADPQFGLKLTGKVGAYTVGALVADDRAPGETVPPDDLAFGRRAFFNILRFTRDIHKESSLGFIWADREFLQSFSRVLGADGRWKLSKSVSMDFQFLKSFNKQQGETSTEGTSLTWNLGRSSRNWNYSLGYHDRSPDFKVDTGFVSRVDYRSASGRLGHWFRPENRWILQWQPYLGGSVLLDYRNVRQDYYTGPGFWIEFVKGTFITGNYFYGRESYQGIDFLRRGHEFMLRTRRSRWFTARASYERGEQINYAPAQGLSPFLGQVDELNFGLTVRPLKQLVVDNTALGTRFLTIGQGRHVFNNNILRSRWNYQFNQRFSLRLIGQYSNVLPTPELSALEPAKTFSGEVLLTYLVNPGTALYVGYTNQLENYDRLTLSRLGLLARSPADLLSTSAGLFVKFSYLFQF